MRFGGHETFHIREGWLHKGVKLLLEEPDKLVDEHAADWLGVGRNMAKSIRHWLVATGLAGRIGTARKTEKVEPTELAELIWANDPYFLESGTWWALHVNLVHQPNHALTWNWFFNRFRMGRFEKPVCMQSFNRYLDTEGRRRPSARTLDRDVACLLSTYSKRLPPTSDDPEEALDCPMTELGLMTHHRDTGVYELHLGKKSFPPALLGYAFHRAFQDDLRGAQEITISLQDAVVGHSAPGAVFALTAEALFEVLAKAEATLDGDLKLTGLASQRAVRFRSRASELEWLGRYYASLNEERHAA